MAVDAATLSGLNHRPRIPLPQQKRNPKSQILFLHFPGKKHFIIRTVRAVHGDGQNGPDLGTWTKEAVEMDESSEIKRRSEHFQRMMEVPSDERDKVQRLQVIVRAAATIAAARALMAEKPPSLKPLSAMVPSDHSSSATSGTKLEGQKNISNLPLSEITTRETPGPDFWSWSPPSDSGPSEKGMQIQKARQSSLDQNSQKSLLEKERSTDVLPIPFESNLSLQGSNQIPLLSPLQSLVEVEKADGLHSLESPPLKSDNAVDVVFSRHAEEAAMALGKVGEASSFGVNADGSRWWKETGTEQRPDGVVCRWTLTRGVSANNDVEWEEKYWEASDEFDYKELGSEKSGRDAAGSAWREFWRESMWQDLSSGLVNMEKTADKWGKNGKGEEWHEKWWEHYDASGKADKWAQKWCHIDPTTPLEPGHAHVWHERWGEEYDGKGGSMKYTDKWAERSDFGGWTKWGDKWDESFDPNGHGVKQGETWWEGLGGERWNRTWGEQHNGSGWVHKYGKSSSGEHWDTHVQQDTWYERFPHYGFDLCFENSKELRKVTKPKRHEL
ncbi:uncharacterized protein LOC18429567 [Amborella trichopoda]|uniref:Uncharacterized protein n=1 Tax=Amborella trichopoda TaxID=13333 RepID=W1P1F7_AMBTC|nr:uncharacterized protein LOC18429567 [Amborella trichopoda]ERN01484.1 hypothetical protein AMTR_s00002p00269840 [Amborella trichopoda]|eukprot:XP_006838915.1 uncharacterized protein LOC18429567 [Amborella trichopoda]